MKTIILVAAVLSMPLTLAMGQAEAPSQPIPSGDSPDMLKAKLGGIESLGEVRREPGGGGGRTNSTQATEWKQRLAIESPVLLPSFRSGRSLPPNNEVPVRLPFLGVSGEIQITADGALAEFGRHKVHFAPNVLAAEPVRIVTPNGTVLRTRVFGLCYIDLTTGESLLIAEPKYAVGQVQPRGRIIYRDAFDTVAADISYHYTSRSLEQDIIIRKQIPAPQDLGLKGENIHLGVLTEFLDAPESRVTSKTIPLDETMAVLGQQVALQDEEVGIGAMRIVQGKAFSLGGDNNPIPVVKRWLDIDGRKFLLEATPYEWIAPKLATLPRFSAVPMKHKPTELKKMFAGVAYPDSPRKVLAQIERTAIPHDATAGVVLDYLIVDQALLNVNFADDNKVGTAAVGLDNTDYWNVYDNPGASTAALVDLDWSDGSGGSAVGIVVSNAPAVGYHDIIEDTMYQNFVYGTNGARLTVTITNLPSDIYDLLVYAPRTPSNGVPVIELKRDGTSLWTKNLSHWGNGWFASSWYSSFWQDHDQYVRFRDIAVTNQTLRIEVIPDAAGLAVISGLQMVPSGAVPSELPDITDLINVDTALSHSNKVGYAVVGLSGSDVWNNYSMPNNAAGSLASLKWSDNTTSSAGLVLRNGQGQWGVMLPDVMYRGYVYSWYQGNITVTVTNLPTGTYDFFLYGHTTTLPDNAIFEVWSDEVNWGIKGTSLQGYGPYSNKWEHGQQYVHFSGVAVASNRPVYLQAKKNSYGYNNLSGFQIARTGDLDSDTDGLPDAWEMKWFGTLDYGPSDDYNNDGISNLRAYELGLIPTRDDTDGDGILDWADREFQWLDDATPSGAILFGTSESWSWQTSWYDGVGWAGATVYPNSGQKFHISANVSGALHQHYFERALGVTRAKTGDVFYAYVNLDSTYPPAEVMLQFYTLGNNGGFTWEHRVYWGANNISSGVNGTVSRTNLGALPPTGQWVRLEVPASVVGLEGKIIEGMGFSLWGGRAAWDSAGVYRSDLDADGLPDEWEIAQFEDLSHSATGDPDGDGFTNLQEYQNGTNPTLSDADPDGDGVVTWIEIAQGRNPNSPSLPGAVSDAANDTQLSIHTPLK